MSVQSSPPSSMPQAVTAPGPQKQVSDAQLAAYAKLIYRQTGIRVPPAKKTLLSNRLRRRLRDTGIEDFGAYYNHLSRLKPDDPEWDAFLQEITTHETYLFRDEAQWEWFAKQYLPRLSAEAATKKRTRSLRIWSAACSTGDEAYSVACCVAGRLPNHSSWQIRIVGTDIGVGAVEQASRAQFGERAMRLVPAPYRQRFFAKARNANVWTARPILQRMVTFRQHNLMEPLRETPFDLVFLKNVLIYFDRDSKRQVLKHVRTAIRPGGLLVAGPADGIGDLVKDYVRLQAWLFQKPLEQ